MKYKSIYRSHQHEKWILSEILAKVHKFKKLETLKPLRAIVYRSSDSHLGDGSTPTAVNHRILSSGRSSPMAPSSQHSGLGAQWFLGAWEVGDVGGSFVACYFMVYCYLCSMFVPFLWRFFFPLFFLLLTYLLVNSPLRVLSSFVLIGGEGRLLQLWSCLVFKNVFSL